MKEGDYSFLNSTSLLPLPDHAMAEYRSGARDLEDDPVYQRHRADWQIFHTRYLAAQNLSSELFSHEPRH